MSGERFDALDRLGLNLQAVFDLAGLPGDLRTAVAPAPGERQLILIGNAGPTLWRTLTAAGTGGADPIDDFSRQAVCRWFAEHCPGHRARLLYPGDSPVGLQRLGQLAGWHHASPFRIGIQPGWGSWFAYRVVLVTDTALPLTTPLDTESPCTRCADTPCITACPADALADRDFSLARCIAYRCQPDSPCASTCLARLACPVGSEHRYDEAQIRHGYGQSLTMIRHYHAQGRTNDPRR